MQVVRELRRVRRIHHQAATLSTFRPIFQGREGFLCIVFVIRARQEQFIGRGGRTGFIEDRMMIAVTLSSEYLNIPPPGEYHGPN